MWLCDCDYVYYMCIYSDSTHQDTQSGVDMVSLTNLLIGTLHIYVCLYAL